MRQLVDQKCVSETKPSHVSVRIQVLHRERQERDQRAHGNLRPTADQVKDPVKEVNIPPERAHHRRCQKLNRAAPRPRSSLPIRSKTMTCSKYNIKMFETLNDINVSAKASCLVSNSPPSHVGPVAPATRTSHTCDVCRDSTVATVESLEINTFGDLLSAVFIIVNNER